MTTPTRVFVVDDHPVYRRALVRIVERAANLVLAGEAADGASAVEEIRTTRPDVVILDVDMPALDGLGVLQALLQERPDMRVLMLSGHLDSEIVYQAVQKGAGGFLSKHEDEDAIRDAVIAVASGETVLGPSVQAAIAAGVRARTSDSALSPREVEVLRLTAGGLSSLEIGRKLHLSPATVKTHLRRTYAKLGVDDRAAAVAEGMRLGLLD